MKVIRAVVEFVLREDRDDSLDTMTEQELSVELKDLLEDEHRGMAEYEFVKVVSFEMIEVPSDE